VHNALRSDRCHPISLTTTRNETFGDESRQGLPQRTYPNPIGFCEFTLTDDGLFRQTTGPVGGTWHPAAPKTLARRKQACGAPASGHPKTGTSRHVAVLNAVVYVMAMRQSKSN
jgi:hypothetical protein